MSVDDRSPMAQAMGWVSLITTASMVLVVPAFGGNWIDRKFQTFPLFFLLGAILGVVAGGWHFYKIVVLLSKDDAGK